MTHRAICYTDSVIRSLWAGVPKLANGQGSRPRTSFEPSDQFSIQTVERPEIGVKSETMQCHWFCSSPIVRGKTSTKTTERRAAQERNTAISAVEAAAWSPFRRAAGRAFRARRRARSRGRTATRRRRARRRREGPALPQSPRTSWHWRRRTRTYRYRVQKK